MKMLNFFEIYLILRLFENSEFFGNLQISKLKFLENFELKQLFFFF